MASGGSPSSISRAGRSEEFYFQLGRGQIGFHTRFSINGYAGSVSTTERTIWAGPTAIYAFPSSALTMSISSSSANDAAAGTGARTVMVMGLDNNYAEITDTVTLNGTTPVNTSKPFFRINRMDVASSGSAKTNVGDISAINGGVTYGIIAAGDGRSATAVYTVPAGQTVFLHNLTASASGSGTAVACLIRILRYSPVTNTNITVNRYVLGNDITNNVYWVPTQYAEKNDIEIRGVTSGNGTFQVAARAQIINILNTTPA